MRLVVIASVVVRSLGWWSLRSGITPRHAAVNHEIRAVDEAALVAGKEKHCLSLLNSFTEAASREVDFAAVTLGLVVAEPVLKEGGAACCQLRDRMTRDERTYFNGAGHSALNLKPSLA